MIQINSIIPVCDSTSGLLKKLLLEKKCGAGDWLRATHQTHGYGRQGRSWLSTRGGFYFSHVLEYPNQNPTWIPLWIGVCLIEALLEIYPEAPLKLKWPNDLYLLDQTQNKKTGGILCESLSVENRRYIVVGIGLNVLEAPSDPLLTQPVGFLGKKGSEQIQKKYMDKIQKSLFLLESTQKLKEIYESHSLFKKGDRVDYLKKEQPSQGQWQGLAEDGAAFILDSRGKPEVLYSEEVHLKRLVVDLKGD